MSTYTYNSSDESSSEDETTSEYSSENEYGSEMEWSDSEEDDSSSDDGGYGAVAPAPVVLAPAPAPVVVAPAPVVAGPVAHAVLPGEMASQCPLCLNTVCDVKFHPCGHLIHWGCYGANSALNVGHTCPNCRAAITDFYNLNGGNWDYDG